MSASMPPEAGPLAIGALFLEKYEIKALIGRGGHAWVYHGVDRFMGRQVAIKIVYRSGGNTRDMLRRAQAEAQFLSRFKHRNVVEVLDGGLTGQGHLYIVMELLQGRSLYGVLRHERRLEIEEGLSVFTQVADAIHAAHEAGAIHRDLKPGNVFVLKGNRVKVLDFGIAKMHDAAWTTQRDIVLGTILYMSPEQIQGRNLTTQSDVYSLGVMLDEALSGEHYIRRIAQRRSVSLDSIYGVMPIIVEVDPAERPIHERDASVPPHIGRIVDRCMAKAPHQRFGSMKEVADALRAAEQRFVKETYDAGGVSRCRDLSKANQQLLEETPIPLSAAVWTGPSSQNTAPDTEPFTGPRFLGAANATPPPPLEAFNLPLSARGPHHSDVTSPDVAPTQIAASAPVVQSYAREQQQTERLVPHSAPPPAAVTVPSFGEMPT
ncbi:MAG TPA: serine/threonine-protein kinase, partial [Polyangiaceae bacterium]|nr:serine/threonine-protein kinase [Polyangiaceae bacterium]